MTASGQLIDPLLDFLGPPVVPSNLYTIRGPIYVEPASLQPPYVDRKGYYGAPLLGPALPVGPPLIGQPVLSPSPYNPYSLMYPGQMMYDEQQDDVSPQTRRLNTNVQSGIQQIGQGNMNLQGNIQQVNRRSTQSQQQQASLSYPSSYQKIFNKSISMNRSRSG